MIAAPVEEGHRLDHREVAARHRLRGEGPDARPREDHLRGDRAGEQDAVGEPQEREHGQGRVPERVLPEHRALGQPLGPRGLDVLARQHVEHAGAEQPQDAGAVEPAQRRRRQDEVPPAAGPIDWKPSQPHAEDQDREDPADERGQRHPSDGAHDVSRLIEENPPRRVAARTASGTARTIPITIAAVASRRIVFHARSRHQRSKCLTFRVYECPRSPRMTRVA